MVFPLVMYGCESWTVKKAECQRIDALELWCWRRLLRVPWTVRRSNQSILKEISPGCSLEGLMLKLKLQYFGHFMQRVDSLENTLMLEGIGDRRRRGWQRMGWLDGIYWLHGHEFEWPPGVGDGQGGLACCGSWSQKESDTTEWLNWTEAVKGFCVVDETEIDVFLKFPCFFYNPANVGNLISIFSSFSKPSLDIWKFLVHVMLKPSMQDFMHDLTSMGDQWNCLMVSTFFGTTLLGNWDEDWLSPVLRPLLGLPDLLT